MATMITFRIHYATRVGESLFLEQGSGENGSESIEPERIPLRHVGDGYWEGARGAWDARGVLRYRYGFHGLEGTILREPGWRRLEVPAADRVTVVDQWFAPDWADAAFLRQAFAGIIFRPSRVGSAMVDPAGQGRLRITLRAPRVSSGEAICISGGHPLLGGWDPARAVRMAGEGYPVWEVDLPADAFRDGTEFKFGIWDEALGRLARFEEGPNRWVRAGETEAAADVLVMNYERFRHASLWRGAGVAIPVFSLRTARGYGVGEFLDLADLARWAAGCGMHLVQVLPVNDTSSDFTWKDSYPYKAISTAALHPLYLNVERVFGDYGVPVPPAYEERRETLNRLPQLDYEAVLEDKLGYLRSLFAQVKPRALAGAGLKAYLRDHAPWLRPYAAFCHLRDTHGTAEFSRWGKDAVYSAKRFQPWFKPGAAEYDGVMFHCWLQFHLDQQLAEALAAGHALGVAFQGDLPIGIDRSSVEAWTEPRLFRMDRQTGAPPDAFAVLGQNWGFPTYHWQRMAADGYAWWRRRLHRMGAAFDALRIDHILGFFRIWEIPQCYREGIMGHYNPALPLSRDEIRHAGFTGDPKRFTVGAVAEARLPLFFGELAGRVLGSMLTRDREGYCRLRPAFSTEAARDAGYATLGLQGEKGRIERGLTRLGFEVLFLEDPDHRDRYHPRINLASTELFLSLDRGDQEALSRLHDDFYFRRHTRFWEEEAMKKLPALMDATPMLLCGEDLGMVPDSVPVVLGRLALLSLEVQRWPKRLGQRLGEPAAYPYLSVCTTSTHDMSTLRGWWEEEPEMREVFWGEVMGRTGPAPEVATPEVCRFIVTQNLGSASMWCILPWQDWLGVDGALRHPVAADERINVPAVPRHYWRYRMHLTLEALARADAFNAELRGLIEAAGR